jgi:hypothetical protein
MKVKLKAWAL